MSITIHQPEHAPYRGLLEKIRKSDLFVVLDNVQFSKNGFQNRNKVRSGWITVPVKKHPLETRIMDIEIGEIPGHSWRELYLKKLWDYSNEPHFKEYYYHIERIINGNTTNLADLNMYIMDFLLASFKIHTRVVRASSFNIPEGKDGSEKVLNICKYFGEDTYLAGEGGKDYMRLDEFEKGGVKVIFNDTDGIEHLSAFDFLFRYAAK